MMKAFASWVNIVNLANEEIERQRTINGKMLEILEAYQFFSSGSGSALGDYESVHRMAEDVIREAKKQS